MMLFMIDGFLEWKFVYSKIIVFGRKSCFSIAKIPLFSTSPQIVRDTH